MAGAELASGIQLRRLGLINSLINVDWVRWRVVANKGEFDRRKLEGCWVKAQDRDHEMNLSNIYRALQLVDHNPLQRPPPFIQYSPATVLLPSQ